MFNSLYQTNRIDRPLAALPTFTNLVWWFFALVFIAPLPVLLCYYLAMPLEWRSEAAEGLFVELGLLLPFALMTRGNTPAIWSWSASSNRSLLENLGVGALVGLITSVTLGLFYGLFGQTISHFTGTPMMLQELMQQIADSSGVELGLLSAGAIVSGPIIEEILFRGLLQSYLRRRFTLTTSIVLSALCFALPHLEVKMGWQNIALLSDIFLSGIVLGYLYERQGSLWAAIACHGIGNAYVILYTLSIT